MLPPAIRALEPEFRHHLRRRYADVPPRVPLRLRQPASRTHHVVVVETASEPVRRLFVKGPTRAAVTLPQFPDMEARILSEVAPRIQAQNPDTASPRLFAWYPDRDCLVMEMVEGETLDALVFGGGRSRSRGALAALFRLSGEWLARFHTLTRSDETGEPFEWVVEALDAPFTRMVFDGALDPRTYAALRALARRFADRFRSFRQPLGLVHHDFTPRHVLVREPGISVIDFASSRPGYRYQDLAHFLGFSDIRFPWRRVVGAVRLPAAARRRAFLDGYTTVQPGLAAPEEILMRFARLLAVAKLVRNLLVDGSDTRIRTLRSRAVSGPWLRHRFRAVCREELRGLEASAGAC